MTDVTRMKLLTNAVVTAANTLLREAGRLFKPFGLTAAHFNVLNLLHDVPDGLRPSDLAREMVVDPSSTTYVLDRMESSGWIRRVDDRSDRRVRRVRLTPAGRALHARVALHYEAALRAMLPAVGELALEPVLASVIGVQRAAAEAVTAAARAGEQRRRRVR